MRGIIVTTHEKNALNLQAGSPQGFTSEGLSPAEAKAVSEVLRKFLSKPVTLHSLDEMAGLVEARLESQRKVMMKAGFPPQEITAGIVVMTVGAARIDRVILRGRPAFGSAFIAKSVHFAPGTALRTDQLAADLDWLNENPLRTVRAELSPSARDDRLNLALQVNARKSWRTFSGVDNSLSDRLGDWRWYVGLQHGNLWNLDHRITSQFTAGLDYEALHGASLTYELPLPWRHLLDVGLSYSESSSQRSSGRTWVDQSGNYQRYQLTYIIPLRSRRGWRLQWRSGLNFRDQLYHLDASTPGTASIQHRHGWHGIQVESGMTASSQDRLGITHSNMRLLWNAGSAFLGSSDQDARQLGAGGSQAWMAELTFQRTLNLRKAGLLMAGIEGQWSDRALLAADQFAPAVFGRVRGFDEITGYGDNGLILSLEWLTPWMKTMRLGTIRGLIFTDGALVHQRQTARDVKLLSTGAGLRWQSKALSLQCDLGIPIHANQAIETQPQARFSMSVRW